MNHKSPIKIVVSGVTYKVIGVHYNCNIAPTVYIVDEYFEHDETKRKWFAHVDKVIYG